VRAKDSYDIVFCDPPFPYSHKRDLLESIGKSRILHDESLLLIHYPEEDRLPESIGDSLRLVDRRAYGRSIVNFYRKEDARGKDSLGSEAQEDG
jgi:16S rRNA (guanine966-N2)-methyltransferase